ncbi:MAG: carboxymuconolactone decarboxylase family protein [Nitrososphaerales archaeon]
MVYYLTRRQYGKVLAPINVFAARMPTAFGNFTGKMYGLDKKMTLPRETQLLIRERVAQINVCPFCMDMTRSQVIKASMNEEKFAALEDYRVSKLFSEAERAMLDYVTVLTEERKVSAGTFARLKQFHSERAICEIVWLVATEHLSNLANIGLNIHSDMVCDIEKKKKHA